MPGLRIEFSSPEAVQRFRDVAHVLLEWEKGELSAELEQWLAAKARDLGVHPLDRDAALAEVAALAAPSTGQESPANKWATLEFPADAWVRIPTGTLRTEDGKDYSVEAFELMNTPVTWGQFMAFCEATRRNYPEAPDWGRSEDHPVVNVNFADAMEYADWMTQQSGRRCRLPTKFEWEYAGRAGTTTACGCNDQSDTARIFFGICKTLATPGNRPPNPWGLYDMHGMHGNVREWTATPDMDGGLELRGGSWSIYARSLRCALRDWDDPGYRDNLLGFRLAKD